jgi:hypothetical protein
MIFILDFSLENQFVKTNTVTIVLQNAPMFPIGSGASFFLKVGGAVGIVRF